MQDKIKTIIMDSLNELNEQLDEDKKLTITDDMPIYGKNSMLDSFDFVNLIVIVEDRIFQELGKSVTIVSEKAFSKKYNPFSNVERLTGFIKELLESEEA
jgi:acyl carrier protein